jgi:hypothetical protein
MLEIRKTAITFEESDLISLERIVLDSDKDEALRFIKKIVYERILHSQHGKLKSLLDGESNSVQTFKRDNE